MSSFEWLLRDDCSLLEIKDLLALSLYYAVASKSRPLKFSSGHPHHLLLSTATLFYPQ